jgi:hypothetical protein
MTYETDENIKEIIIRINDDGTKSYIPMVEGNSDYARYLRWLENPDADEAQSL